MGKATGVRETVHELEEFVAAVDAMPGAAAIAIKGAEIMRPLMPLRSGALRATARGEVINGAAVITAGGPNVLYAGAANARTQYVERTITALEPVATAELEDGITHEIQNRGLNR